MTTLDQIVDLADLEREIAAGYINRRIHPEFPTLATAGYSDKCQFDNHWTAATRACRGIIYDTETLEVIARPFAKFFNYGQGDDEYDLDAPILGAWDKFDGSLGIRYTRPDGRTAIATRGSFDSEQARHATALAWEQGWPALPVGMTPLYEIIYPENRIVLDYGDRDELVFLGAVDIETGAYLPGIDGPAPAVSLRGVLSLPPRKNAEGWVIWLNPWTAVKLKQDDYVALHRIVTSLSVKEVWRQLRAGTFREFAEGLPDEFHGWAKATRDDLAREFVKLSDAAYAMLDRVKQYAADDRKSQALWLNANAGKDVKGLVFSLLDGKDISESVWKAVEPSGAVREIPTSELLSAGATT
jgi:RNA ligase